ncbi:MAG: polysaccharide deacetylase family protein [Pseudomonadota bacterium]|nr:polysaccharide deacetylase family protein [Pseudomonadota bacterium]
MIITPESLNQHLALLRNLGGTFVRLSDWLQKAEAGKPLPRLSVAVTFDDGWQDNYQYAYPILRKHQVPATIFLVSRRINTDWQFWPERVLNLLVNHADRLDEPALAWLRAHCPDRRHAMNLIEADSVIHRLKSLDDQTIETHLEETEQALPGLTHPASDRSLLNDREILEMAESGLMEFGAHTQHHYRLNLLKDPSHLQREIVESLRDVENKGARPVAIFCYPNGDISARSETLVKQHFGAACTTLRGWNRTPASPYSLRRFNFHDGNGGSALSFLATLGRPGS